MTGKMSGGIASALLPERAYAEVRTAFQKLATSPEDIK